MKSNSNENFGFCEKEDISWTEVHNTIPKLLKLIQQILIKKIEDRKNNIITSDFFKGKDDFEITAEEPYIMNESDFDDIHFYEYILKVSLYFLKKKDNNTINKLEPAILKHLIDLGAILQIILYEDKNYEKRDVKYYLYHLINAFSEDDDKLENDYKFLKCGIELLIKNYEIKDYKEYFPEKDKIEMRHNFSSSIDDLLFNLQQYIINNKYYLSKEEKEIILFNKVTELKGKTRELIETNEESNYLEKVDSLLKELNTSLDGQKTFKSIKNFISSFDANIPENINDFYYSIFCCNDNKITNNDKTINNTGTSIINFRTNKICDVKTKDSLLKYYFQFLERGDLFYKLISGDNSNKIYFQELLEDKKFRDKVINFYSSQKIKDFINQRCNKNEKDRIMEKLPHLLNLMEENNFWKQIILFPMSEHKMASVENYLRIVINTEYVNYYNTSDDQKKTIVNLLLFELLIHETFHFLRRLVFSGEKSKDAITPPSSYDKDKGEKEEKDENNSNNEQKKKNSENEESANEDKKYGEIGQRLIKYIFNVDKIVIISYKAAKIFEDFTLKDEKEIEQLKTILSNESNSYAKFTLTNIEGICHRVHDCRTLFSTFDEFQY